MKILANIFGYILNFIYNFVNNYGIAIIIFTIILKLVMLPISIKQQKTMKKSAKMQEKVKEIQEKYSNDSVRQSQELMDLYKSENMSPFSGCLTSIIQMIIIISVFLLVRSPLTYMKHIDQNKLNSYSSEVSNSAYQEIEIIKKLADKDEDVRINMNFLGLDLSDIPVQNYTDIKVYIIPVLYVLTSILSTRLTMALNKKSEKDKNEEIEDNPKKDDDVKEEDMMTEMNKQMTFMMPIMTVSIALVAPLGLALYWLVSNLLMIGERIYVDKYFKEEEE